MNNKIEFNYQGFTVKASFYWHKRGLEIDTIDIEINGIDMFDKLTPKFRDELEEEAWQRGTSELIQHG